MTKNKANNTVVKMEMADGPTVKLTLAYRFLLQLSNFDRKVYDEYNAVWNKKEGKREEIDNIRVLYAAYLCACIQDGTQEAAMSWDEWLDNVTLDREAVGRAMMELLAPKRKGDIGTRSE